MQFDTNRFKSIPLHPFLIAGYAVLALLGHNIEEIPPVVALRGLLVTLAACTIIYLGNRLWLKDWRKAAILTTIMLVLFFSYGHVYDYLEGIHSLGRHRYLAPIYLGLFILSVWWIRKEKRDLRAANHFINLIAVVALVFPLYQITLFAFRSSGAAAESAHASETASDLTLPKNQPAPDIYYIILDAYARDDALAEDYGLDNKPFLKELSDQGFYVATCSQSNYAQTQLSLGSSLNMNFLNTLSRHFVAGSTTRVGLDEIIHNNTVRRELKSLGYKTVAFETGFMGTQWENADLYLSPRNPGLLGGGLNDFEVMLLRTSGGLLLQDGVISLPKYIQPDFNNPRRIHRDLILYDLDQLAKLPSVPGPKFVFAHMVIPHPPYVFGPNGEFTDFDKDPYSGYRDQIEYINKRIVPVLEKIIHDSATPPIIIVQGDHGSVNAPPNLRMDILNAYYLPDGGAQALYKNISPVNTFRVIFNTYFGGKYPLLEDVSYYSIYQHPFDYTVIPNTRPGCNP